MRSGGVPQNDAGGEAIPDAAIALVRAGFATDWYVRTYRADLDALIQPDETPFDFYLRKGARLGHDPNPHFSEIHYRLNRPDLVKAMQQRSDMFGFAHCVSQHGSRGGVADVPHAVVEGLRLLVLNLDRQTVEDQLGAHRGMSVSYVDAYVSAHLSGRKPDPNPDFSETAYLACNPDLVRVCGRGRQFVSGYQHYLLWGKNEGRSVAQARAGHVQRRIAGMWGRVRRGWTHA